MPSWIHLILKTNSSGLSFWTGDLPDAINTGHELWLNAWQMLNHGNRMSGKTFFWPNHSYWFDRWEYFVFSGTWWHIHFWQVPEAELSDLTQSVNFQSLMTPLGEKCNMWTNYRQIQGKLISDIFWISEFSYLDINYSKTRIIYTFCLFVCLLRERDLAVMDDNFSTQGELTSRTCYNCFLVFDHHLQCHTHQTFGLLCCFVIVLLLHRVWKVI